MMGCLALVVSPSATTAIDLTTAFQLDPPSSEPESSPMEAIASLPIPPTAANAPIQEPTSPDTPLPPPPPFLTKAPSPPPSLSAIDATPAASEAQTVPSEPLELSFGLSTPTVAVLPATSVALQPAIAPHGVEDTALDPLFAGGAASLVARVVGSAEGTRTPEGHRTPAFYGHRDPGNGVWNLGSFSYQHGAASPEEADERQLKRLKQQAIALQQKAAQAGLDLTLAETLNGIDLANQAPQAALDRDGYIDWLLQARQLKLEGDAAILWARTRSFLDPDTQQWNAPGLGNTVQSITHDQERRMQAIARALTVYQDQQREAGISADGSANGLQPISPEDLGVARLLEVDVFR